MKHMFIAAGAALTVAFAGAAHGTVYTSDPSLADFTAGEVYATFTHFTSGDAGPSPYTPTNATISRRVYDGNFTDPSLPANNWILATFAAPTSKIRVFENEDHFGAAYDGYQYTIYGQNKVGGFDFLYDTLTVAGSGEPFTIGSFSGTAPHHVNNVLSDGGPVAYISDFTFGSAYSVYAFGASKVAIDQGNADQEFSAIGRPGGVPEPATWAMMLVGFSGLGALLRRRRAAAGAAAA